MLSFYLTLIDDKEDQEKFEKIYYKYRYLMFATAKNIFNDNRLAEEAVQEAFIKIAKIVNKIEDIDSHKTKNLTVIITRNTSLDLLDKERRHRGLVCFEDIKDIEGFENFSLETIEQTEIIKAINELPDEDRDIIFLKYYYSFSEKEIAGLMAISYDATRKRMERARNKLEKKLNDWR